MAPEEIGGGTWRLFRNERVEGWVTPTEKRVIRGPAQVRVQEFDFQGRNFLRVQAEIQGEEISIQVEAPDFPSVVRRLGD